MAMLPRGSDLRFRAVRSCAIPSWAGATVPARVPRGGGT